MEAQPLLAVVDHKPAPATAPPCCCCRRVRCCWCCCRIPRWGCVLLSIAAVLCVLATAATCVYFLVIHKHVPEYFPPSGPCPRACTCHLRAPCFRGPHVCFSCVCLWLWLFVHLGRCVWLCVCGCVCVAVAVTFCYPGVRSRRRAAEVSFPCKFGNALIDWLGGLPLPLRNRTHKPRPPTSFPSTHRHPAVREQVLVPAVVSPAVT